MHYIIAGGTGFIGQALVYHWLAQGHKLTVIGRNAAKIQTVFNQKVKSLTWQQLEAEGENSLVDAYAIINLVGENIGAKPWTAKRKETLLASRVKPTQILAKLCARLGQNGPVLLNASGVGVYGLQTEITADNAYSEAIPLAEPESFLAILGQAWEQALAPALLAKVRTIMLRLGVVIGAGGVIKQLLPIYRLGLGGKLGNGRQPFAWISIIDVCAAIDFILANPSLQGPVNLVAPQTVNQAEFAKSLCQRLHKPCWSKLPAAILNLFLGQLAKELLLQGQHVIPLKLVNAGFTFKAPDLNTALERLKI